MLLLRELRWYARNSAEQRLYVEESELLQLVLILGFHGLAYIATIAWSVRSSWVPNIVSPKWMLGSQSRTRPPITC